MPQIFLKIVWPATSSQPSSSSPSWPLPSSHCHCMRWLRKICRFQCSPTFPPRVSKSRIKHRKAVSKFSMDFSKVACGDFLPSSHSNFFLRRRKVVLVCQNIFPFGEKKNFWKRCAVVSSYSPPAKERERYLWEKGFLEMWASAAKQSQPLQLACILDGKY